MALLKYNNHLRSSNNVEFDKIHSPGHPTGWSGIYRCTVCGREVVSVAGHPLPPQNHHQHPANEPIRWKLNVASDHA
jgi:hypothetical protein